MIPDPSRTAPSAPDPPAPRWLPLLLGLAGAILLPVAGAYHSRLMCSAQELLAGVLASAAIQSPAVPVVCIVAPVPAVALWVLGTVNVTEVPETTDAMV